MLTPFNEHVRISKQAKRITLQRFLLTKVVYFTEDFGIRDLACLFENQLWLEHEVQTNPNFQQSFGQDLESLSVILKEINFRMEFTERSVRRFAMRIKQELEPFIFPKRNYPEIAKRYGSFYHLEPNSPLGKLVKLIPPKGRIGKGYSDKGTARNPAVDGSPSWQEVAMSRGPIYQKGVKQDDQITERDQDHQTEPGLLAGESRQKPSRFYRYLQEVAGTLKRAEPQDEEDIQLTLR